MTITDESEFLMGDRQKGNIGRRQLLRAGMIGFIATATSVLRAAASPLTPRPKTKNARLAFRRTPSRSGTSTGSTATRSAEGAAHADKTVGTSSATGENSFAV